MTPIRRSITRVLCVLVFFSGLGAMTTAATAGQPFGSLIGAASMAYAIWRWPS